MIPWLALVAIFVSMTAFMAVSLVLFAGVVQRAARDITEAISSQQAPNARENTVVQYVHEPSDDRVTPDAMVEAWATEQEVMGKKPSAEEIAVQKEVWAQNEELL